MIFIVGFANVSTAILILDGDGSVVANEASAIQQGSKEDCKTACYYCLCSTILSCFCVDGRGTRSLTKKESVK
jgi:hypothetical protein